MPTKEETVTRKLRAILSADVKGYSLLMSDDEAFTVKTLKSYRKVMSAQIVRHKGRVVDAPGDNLMAEFASVVDAVQCAVEIQKKLKEKNQDFPENKRLEFRIGVNIGDVIQDGDNLYGEGVNIAARIEGLADAGGVCISRNAYDHIKNKLTLGYEYIGEHDVKNIKDPVRVYKVLMGAEDAGKLIGEEPKHAKKKWFLPVAVVAAIVVTSIVWHFVQSANRPEFEPASIEKMAYPLPDKISIAVLPFDNMTGDPEQEYFSDGLSEEIITALSIVPELYVIARNSTFTYKGKPMRVQQVSEELGVQYVLEGSVRKSGDKVRITAQLIDALNGYHLWAETYDREFEDLFDLQEEISLKIITELRVKLTKKEGTRFAVPCSENLKAYRKYMQALDHFYRANSQDVVIAQGLAEQAIELDPGYACAYSLLGAIHRMALILGLSKSPMQTLIKAQKYVEKAIDLNPTLSGPHGVLSLIYQSMGQYDKSFEEAKKTIEFNPNSLLGNYAIGSILMYMGRSEESIIYIKKVIRLDPFSTFYFTSLGMSYFFSGQYQEAIGICEKANDSRPHNYFIQICLASAYSAAGNEEKAHIAATEILKIDPTFSLKGFSKKVEQRYKKQADIELYISSLRKAGLPE